MKKKLSIRINYVLYLILLTSFALFNCSKANTYKVGDTLKTSEQTVGTISEPDFDEMIRISNAKDASAFSNMIISGRMLVIESGTPCKVIETNIGKVKCNVSIAGIDHKLWINSKFVK